MKKSLKNIVAIFLITLVVFSCKKNTDDKTDNTGLFGDSLGEQDNAFLESISVPNPALNQMVGEDGNLLAREAGVQGLTKDLINKMLQDAQSLSGQKILSYPSEGDHKPQQMGLVYSKGQRDITQRLAPPMGNALHRSYYVYGTDCSGLMINLLRDAGIKIANTDVAHFETTLKTALKTDNTYKNLILKNLGYIPSSEIKSGDFIEWPQHIGIVCDLGNLGKIVFQSNGTGDPADEAAQAKNLSLKRGVHPIDLIAATTGTGYWGTGYVILRLLDATKVNYLGKLPTSLLYHFADLGSPFCTYTNEYTNTLMTMEFDKTNNTATTASLSTTITETVSSCQYGIIPPNINIYSLNSSNYDGTYLTITFKDNPNNWPPLTNNAYPSNFVGIFVGDSIPGSLYLHTSDPRGLDNNIAITLYPQ